LSGEIMGMSMSKRQMGKFGEYKRVEGTPFEDS
jgi:hypothetical protein